MTASIVQKLEEELGNVNREIAMLEERRQGIRSLLATYTGQESQNDAAQDMPTIQMAREVLAERGVPMATAEIRRGIQRKFNAVPASSLQQMLYTRAAQGKTFFNENKKYGLLIWKAKR